MAVTASLLYEDFELLVAARNPNGYPVTVLHSPAGEANALCTLDVADAELQDALRLISGDDVDANYAMEWGRYLFEELFTGEIAELYHSSLNMVRGQNKQLRVRLRIEPPEMTVIPWEFLYDSKEDSFLAISPETALVRYVPLRLPVRPTLVSGCLRVLLVLSTPIDLPSLNLEQETHNLREALAQSIERGSVQLHVLEHAHAAAISQVMRTIQPHVFHYVGHGHFVDENAYLALEDEAGKAHFVDERTFREFFTGANETRLALLNGCSTATLSASQPLVGLAPRLLQRNLSAVVAMQRPISDAAALVFAREFYRGLVQGYPLEAAVADGRKGIYLAQDNRASEWATPVLFLRAPSGQLFATQETNKQANNLPPPPEPTKPPLASHFIGRQDELSAYSAQLSSVGVAVISGMPGVGKTMLAATLVARLAKPEQIFWHSFHPGEGVQALIWKLAGFLAWHGKDEIWRILQNSVHSGGQSPPPAVLLDYLLQALQGTDYWLCWDDFQHVEADPLAEKLLERICALLSSSQLRLVITSRVKLSLALPIATPALQGLNLSDTDLFLESAKISLSTSLRTALQQWTEGNPQLLTLATQVLRQSGDPAKVIQRLAAHDDIEHYLLREVDKQLSENEKAAMTAIAILLGYSGSVDAVEEVLGGVNLRRSLAVLSSRHLLIERADEYSQHAIVQQFYYQLIDRRTRQIMHLRAGEFYEFEEVDDFRAALYYQHAGEMARAAQLIGQNIETLISQGYAQATLSLLAELPLPKLDAAGQSAVLRAQGDLYHLLGELDRASECFEKALRLADPLDHTNYVRLCRKLGDVLARKGDYPAALQIFDRGYQRLLPADQSSPQRGLLAVGRGTVLMNLGQYEAALAEAGVVLNHLNPAQQPRIVADAHDLAGKIAYFQGGFVVAIEAFKAALQLRQSYNDQRDILKSYSNLAVIYGEQNRYAEALQANRSALLIAERIGDLVAIANLYTNMGADLSFQENDVAALDFYQRGLSLFEQIGDAAGRQLLYHNLGDIYRRLSQYESAIEHLLQAIGLAEQLGEPKAKLEGLNVLARVYFEQGRIAEALEKCEQSLSLGDAIEEHQWRPHTCALFGGGNTLSHTPGLRIMPLRVAVSTSEGVDCTISVKAIDYARSHGAQIINLSYGDGESCNEERHAIQRAFAAGLIVVAGAGNNGSDRAFYPAAYSDGSNDDLVIAVAGVYPNGKAHESNYGEWVDISAPYRAYSTTKNAGYEWAEGTSFSAPFVSGLLGVVISNYGWSGEKALSELRKTASNIDVQNPQFAGMLGAGLISAEQITLAPLPPSDSQLFFPIIQR